MASIEPGGVSAVEALAVDVVLLVAIAVLLAEADDAFCAAVALLIAEPRSLASARISSAIGNPGW